ncbi:NAD-dependent epimerase/dehydratase family protein [Subtercola lobariae]|nr:NAD-dependent epimerase/dehydratase family protein [Subtercola lobariae]
MVTGGLGVNGAWLLRELLARDNEVIVFENRHDTSLIDDVADRVQIVIGDITDAAGLAEAVRQVAPDSIVHLAAFVDCENDPVTAVAVNVGGTTNVLAAAAAAGVRRVVFTSSKAVYAPAIGAHGHPEYRPIGEDDAQVPTGMYGITKAAGEAIVDWYGRTTDVECVSLRFATIFGPGRLQRHSGSINTYSSMIELPAMGQPFALDHGGDEGDGLIYVLDVADAIATVTLAPGVLPHSVYNVADGGVWSMNDFANSIRALIPDAELEVGSGLNPMNQPDPYYMAIDASRMAGDFGWRPQYGLDRAIEHYVGLVRARV